MNAYSETLDWIYNLRGGIIELRLDRMRQAMSLFGHPERQFRAFHIAGTNGKGSTAAMLHKILTLAGFRTGLYTSPHLVSFTERIRVGDQEIAKDDVVALGRELNERLTTAGIALTFFEFVTAMAFVYFARRRIDVGVIEVGLGGRLDATNLVRPLVSLITTIARDHEAYLGSDLLSIGREKAGILKTNVPGVCGALPAEVAALVRETATQQNSRVYILGSDFKIFLKKEQCFDYNGIKRDLTDVVVALHGPHQCANAALAIAALELSGESFPVSEEAIRTGLGSVSWPGRFEILREHPWIILDGAHNGEGINALAETLRQFKQGRKIKLLFAAMEDKDWRHMLSILLPFVDELIVTRVQMDRSAAPEQIASQFSADLPCRVIRDAASALKLLVHEAGPDEIVLAAGSLYLIGEIRTAAQELALFCGEP